jgi:histone deacetylase 1/2
MSMLTNQYFEIPSWEQGFSHLECGAPPSKSAKRRFFQSNGVWDDMTGRASARMSPGLLGPQNNALSALMERGGRGSESSSADEIDAFSWDEPMVVEA